jgi:NADH-quinone oxidoreductase subunit J
MDIFFFALFAIIAVICGISVITRTHPIASALSLIGVMCSLAVLYLLLGAEFVAMVQIIVYAGAIMVLFIFVIMLLNAGAETGRGRSLTAQIMGVPALIAFLGAIVFSIRRLFPTGSNVVFGAFTGGTVEKFGHALFFQYLLPFEVTSILILVAILGAIVLARKEID